MLKKSLSIIFLIILFILCTIFLVPHNKAQRVDNIISPSKFIVNNKIVEIENIDYFDDKFTLKNKKLADSLKISESEAFILGNLTKYWTENLMQNRTVFIHHQDLIYSKYSYRQKFMHSGFCLIDSKPYIKPYFDEKLLQLKKAKYQILDLETEQVYEITPENAQKIKNFILIKKSHLQTESKMRDTKASTSYITEKISIHLTDLTTKLYPDKNCSSDICKQILYNINNAHKTIDMAIYGYSHTPAIEIALRNAINRGVKIRLVYDEDNKGENIYPHTNIIKSIIPKNTSDINSSENKNIMHNKFYLFDDKVLITGSANLSHTDMSGFNSNSIIIVESEDIVKIYKKEFEQMFNGKFHNDKTSYHNKSVNISGINLDIYFSPQDKALSNAILPLIRNANKYIYIPTFLLTDDNVSKELLNAHKRGVEVKIIIDALNSSIKRSKHNYLRQNGVLVKTENYAGKMHSKSIIIDDIYTIIGSMNFSYSGENRNDENIVVIKDSGIAKFYKEFFLYQWNKIDDKYLKTNVRAEGKFSIGSCFDGIDNNYDGFIDKNDVACK